jgi:hypothetical protein
MKEQIKQRWVEALRSGKYEQDRGVLRSTQTDGFCCLGVLCDLYIQDHPDVQWEQDLENGRFVLYGETGVLPSNVVTWAGLTDTNPEVKVPDDDDTGYCGGSLAGLNDMGHSFEKIAQVIEEQL